MLRDTELFTTIYREEMLIRLAKKMRRGSVSDLEVIARSEIETALGLFEAGD